MGSTKQKNPQSTLISIGMLGTFIVEPSSPHSKSAVAYVCITSSPLSDTIFFSPTSSVDVGDVDAHASCLEVPVDAKQFPKCANVESLIGLSFTRRRKGALVNFIIRLYNVYTNLYFAYLEINPLVVLEDGSVHYLDMVAKLDQTTEFICGPK